MFCFDNTFSALSEKLVFFELILDNMEKDEEEAEDWKEYVQGTDVLDMKMEDIMGGGGGGGSQCFILIGHFRG